MEIKLIGSKIADARKKLNISQAQLAERLFISPQAVGKWERGESVPDIITCNRLAKILQVDLNYFSESFSSAIPGIPTAEPLELPSAEPDLANPEKKLLWDMSRGNWVGADFSGLKDLREKFSSSNLQRCQFINSDLSGLLLKSNHVDSCDFSGSRMNNSHIQDSHLGQNIFKDCYLADTKFSGSHIWNGDFAGANLTGALFKSCAFQKSTLVNAVLNRTSFMATHLTDVVFEGTLNDCYFENCSFSKVTFQNATLIQSFFKNKSLKGIRFIDCRADRMTYEFLKNGKADLSGITLLTA